jgi:hypothetical protein
MSAESLVFLYENADKQGRSSILSLGASQRYELMPMTRLGADGMLLETSSASVTNIPESGATSLICFGPAPFDYHGTFVQLTSVGKTSEFKFNFPLAGFDNKTTSALVVRRARGSEVALSFRDVFLDPWRQQINESIKNVDRATVTVKEDPVLTWEMFPQLISGLDPALRYLKIYQLLNVDIDCWAYDYEASITFWIFLSRDSGGKAQGFVARAGVWVEDGIHHDAVKSRLEESVLTGIGTLNIELAKKLDPFSGIKLTDIYYLPGRQNAAPSAGVMTGSTADDVTIVLQT